MGRRRKLIIRKIFFIGMLVFSIFLLMTCDISSPFTEAIWEQIVTDLGGGNSNPTLTVSYDGNGNTGGTAPVDMNSYEEGETVTVMGNTGSLTKSDYTFAGWTLQADGGSTGYAAGVTFIMRTADVTFYAQWTHSVTYNGNGATDGAVPTDSNAYVEGATGTILGNTGNLINIDGTTTAYYFDGWNTAANGNGTAYVEDDTFTMGLSNVVLYAQWVPYELRGTGPAGGLVFHDKGSYSNDWRYLEATLSDQGIDISFDGSDATLGATGTIIGTGKSNTTTIVAAVGAGTYAAQLCNDLTIGGYSDWFLPSKDELNEIYNELHDQTPPLGGFTDDDYWTSSEHPDASLDYAWRQDFTDGVQNGTLKPMPKYVRAIRAF